MWNAIVAGSLVFAMAVVSHQIPDLDQLQWQNRVVLLFAEEAGDAQLQTEEHWLENSAAELSERDMKVFALVGSSAEATRSRQRFSVAASGFSVILIGKDGTRKLHRSKPVKPEELFALVDSMPMRRAEKRGQ